MTPTKSLSRIALAVAAAVLPLAAQTPLFNDGTAFGGSKVFSEGLNPLSNPARFDRPISGWYMSIVDGDQRAQDNSTILQDTASLDPAAASAALLQLQDAPWALRTRAYGFTGVKDGMNFGLTREEFRSELAHVDPATLHLNSAAALGDNATFVDGRRAVVDRLNFGGGSLASGTSVGYGLRFEKWEMGLTTPYLNGNGGAPGGLFPFIPVDTQVMAFSTTGMNATNWALDLGFTTDLAQGVRLGAMVDQLNQKRLWDVAMKPQFRAALQLDLGPSTQFTAEGDINGVERMPFPVKQQSLNGTLRYQISPTLIFQGGLERKKIDDVAVNRIGATLQLRTPSLVLSLGFQAGQDQPLKGLALMVN